eukprot:CCRYP_020643-RA/>CCRYP_020643-RA protein AED:0.02 eAED:0.02 QI:334/1/1/1/0/0.25/4/2319/223
MELTGDIFKSLPESKQKAEDNSVGVVKEVPILTEEVLADHNKTTKNHDADKRGDAAKSEPPDDSRSQIGAGVLAGITAGSTGLFLGGPFLGAISGASAYYVASNNDGPIGDAARNTGDWAVKTGAKVGETVREADERHNIFDQVQNFFSNGWQRVCQLDQEHKASERVKETVSEVGAKTIEFERNHHFMENTLVGIQKGIDFVLEKLKGATNNENSNAHSTNS